MLIVFFFFSSRRRHTRLQGDWSSDVCSSDLRSADWPWPISPPMMALAMLPPPMKAMTGEAVETVFMLVAVEKENEEFRACSHRASACPRHGWRPGPGAVPGRPAAGAG